MSALGDAILAATSGPTVNDGLALWFGRQKTETLGDAERRWLLAQTGAAGGTIGDLWYAVLRAAGHTGSVNDMKLAYWSGVLGVELAVNGDFATDTVWTKGTGWTIAGGVAVGAAGSASALTQGPVALTLAKVYYVVFDLVTRSAGGVGPNIGATLGTLRVVVGRHAEFIVAGASSAIIMDKDALFVGSIDNVSVREVA